MLLPECAVPDREKLESYIIGLYALDVPLREREALFDRVRNSGGVRAVLAQPDALAGFSRLSSLLRAEERTGAMERVVESARAKGIGFYVYDDEEYPPLLRTIALAPLVLSVRGSLGCGAGSPAALACAIVGSRRADSEGLELARSFAATFVRHGVCVVSGLAVGIDTAAHRAAISETFSPSTIAVLGSGIEELYPRQNESLAAEIVANGGAVISQFHPKEKPLPHNFLDRNRIIAGIGSATVVISAGDKSGALVTARHAAESGREVMVVPGSVMTGRFKGSHRLLRDGASLIESPREALELIGVGVSDGVERKVRGPTAVGLSGKILEFLRVNGVTHYDAMRGHFSGENEFDAALMQMELEGQVNRGPGNYLHLVRSNRA